MLVRQSLDVLAVVSAAVAACVQVRVLACSFSPLGQRIPRSGIAGNNILQNRWAVFHGVWTFCILTRGPQCSF